MKGHNLLLCCTFIIKRKFCFFYMMAATTSYSNRLQLLYNVPWIWHTRNDCNVLLLEPPVCNSQHSTLKEPERCWLCEPESSMVLIRSKGNLWALSSPMATWITVSHPPPPASCGLLTPPTLRRISQVSAVTAWSRKPKTDVSSCHSQQGKLI